jgi:hypothetical protein
MIFVLPPIVIPAKAGIHCSAAQAVERWAPVFTGATKRGASVIDKTFGSVQ